MGFGVAVSCCICKFVGSQIFFNAKKERICAECIQKEHDNAIDNVQRAFDEMYKMKQLNDELKIKIEAVNNIDWSIKVLDEHLDRLKEALIVINEPKIEVKNE